MQPLISIITVTRNCDSTLARTLDSIRAIKTPEIEYIIIDGQSTDATLQIISQYADCVDQLVSEADTGIYNAMNKGATRATGKFILFLNGDDHLLPVGFNEAKKILNDKNPEILSCVCDAVAEDGTRERVLSPAPALLRFFNTIPHLSTFVAAPLQKKYGFREHYRIAADYDLFLRMYLAGHHFLTSDLVTAVHYRGGFSANVAASGREILEIRKSNLSFAVLGITNAIMSLNRWRKKIQARAGR